MLVALLLAPFAHASCDTRVPADFATVQAAIDGTADGGTICIDPGVWRENLVVDSRVLNLVGAGSKRTVLDGGGLDRAVWAYRSTLGLTDLTVRHGSSDVGGGILMAEGALSLSRVDVSDNVATMNGGGVYGALSVVDLDRVRIFRNRAAGHGGGIGVDDGQIAGSNVVIGANLAHDSGGGLYAITSDIDLDNASILGNRATDGGGFDWSDVTGGLTASVVSGNHAENEGGGGRILGSTDNSLVNVALVRNDSMDGAALEVGTTGATTAIRNTLLVENTAANMFVGGVYIVAGATVAFAYDDFWGNSGLNVTGFQPNPVGVNGTIAADPAFVSEAGASPFGWDLHLQAGSPCIDVGDPALADPDGSRSDMGAYGGPLAE